MENSSPIRVTLANIIVKIESDDYSYKMKLIYCLGRIELTEYVEVNSVNEIAGDLIQTGIDNLQGKVDAIVFDVLQRSGAVILKAGG